MTDAGCTFEEQLELVCEAVTGTDPAWEQRAWDRLDQLTKPPRSLGRIESLAARIACIRGTDHPDAGRKAVVLAAADHGVVAEGVSPFPQEVTWQMVANFSARGAAISQFSASVGAEVFIYDVGVVGDTTALDSVYQVKVAHGTENMALGPAMTREQAAKAFLVGVEAARELAQQGYDIIATGEMGIGNTTAAAALAVAYTSAEVEQVIGRGTGLDDAGLLRKAEVVRRALHANEINALDALGKLAAVGGLEIAMLAGVMVGGAEEHVPVVVDGFISGAAALAAVNLCPAAGDYLIASHLSVEPGHAVVLRALGIEPILQLDMRLGEGTGAALALGVADAACRMLTGMATFAEAGVSGSDA